MSSNREKADKAVVNARERIKKIEEQLPKIASERIGILKRFEKLFNILSPTFEGFVETECEGREINEFISQISHDYGIPIEWILKIITDEEKFTINC